IPKEAVTRYLGPKAPRYISYPAAAVGGFVLAVCSCTVLPLFAGIWRRGAGLGPAITFLFIAPAVNILAIAYTGAAIGMEFALARIVLSFVFGIGIGLIMAALFRSGDQATDGGLFEQQARVRPAVWLFFALWVGILIAGTLQVDLLTRTYATVHLPFDLPAGLQATLNAASLTVQGTLLILLLGCIAVSAKLGLDGILEGANRWTWASLALVALTLLVAAPKVGAAASIQVEITGRAVAVAGLLVGVAATARWGLTPDDLSGWLWETWRFVKQIFPLLIVGVFGAGVIKAVIPAQWVQTLAGSNTVWANLVGVIFGVFMYFPTLVEVPIARMFLDLGMHRGPLLAYLMADPELSVQSILVTSKIMGGRRTTVYVALVAIFSTLAGYLFGLAMVAL
ncbi:MAG: permease, partial [Chloroflexi bacterium]|nr:permease [Chloroflexota bacterium]